MNNLETQATLDTRHMMTTNKTKHTRQKAKKISNRSLPVSPDCSFMIAPLPVSPDCSFMIAPFAFSNVY
jgi:hypothetical protein